MKSEVSVLVDEDNIHLTRFGEWESGFSLDRDGATELAKMLFVQSLTKEEARELCQKLISARSEMLRLKLVKLGLRDDV